MSFKVFKINHDNNFSIIRYILAAGVFINHFNVIFNEDFKWIISSHNRVGAFFAISGFLIIGSLFKGSPFKKYAINRAWRIFPSYFFVVVSVAVLFCFISNLTASEYYTDSGFWKYLAANLSFLNFLHPSLPGCFTGVDANAVNGSLWTMKIEIQLSLMAPLFVYLCKKYNLNVFRTIVMILIISLLYRMLFLHLYTTYEKPIYEILGRQLLAQMIYFFIGIAIYSMYDKFNKYKYHIIALSATLHILFSYLVDNHYYYALLQPYVITTLVISLALIPGNIMKYIDRGYNISYEIYLSHFPCIIFAHYLRIDEKYGIYAALAASILFTIFFSIITFLTVGQLYKKRNKFKNPIRQENSL